MSRDLYNDGDLVTDDLGRLWLVSSLRTGQGLLMPELPDFLTTQEEKKAALEGFEFDQMADGIAAEREACAKIADREYELSGENNASCGACVEIAGQIRSRK